MRVFDKTKSVELKDYDLIKGYLIEDELTKILPEQKEQKEVFHYETIAEYKNGGKSVKKIIDQEYLPYLPEREEVEKIYVYVEYTKRELEEFENEKEMTEIDEWFVTYDRVCMEHMRCVRINTKCHHNIEEWDKLAVEKANRLKQLKGGESTILL